MQRPSVTLCSTIAKQQKHPAVRVVQLGEEDSYGSSAEHYRPPVAPPQAVLAAEVPSKSTKDTTSDAANTASSSSSSRSCRPDFSGQSALSGTNSCVLPQLHPSHHQQQQDATSGCTALADISLQPSVTLQQAGATAPASTLIASGSYGQPAEGIAWQCDDDLDSSSLYAPRCSSRGGVGSLPLSSHTSSRTLNSSSSLNSNILALQQRLLLHPPPYGSLGGGSSTMLAGSRPAAAAAASLAGSCTQGSTTAAAAIARPVSGRALLCSTGAASPQGTAPGFCLHSRMATTAARAQLLLTRDLTSLVTPHTPRMRQLLSPAPSTNEGPAAEADPCSRQLQQQMQVGTGEGFGVPARVQPVGPASSGSSLRFVSSSSKCGSRPSSAPRARLSSGDTAPTGAGSYDSTQGGAGAAGMSYGAGNSCSSNSSYLTPAGGVSRRPVSATAGGIARRSSSSSSSNDTGTASGRPSTSGSLLSSALTGKFSVETKI